MASGTDPAFGQNQIHFQNKRPGMRWFKPNLRSSIIALLSLGHPGAHAEPPVEHSLEDIRDAMLRLIDDDTDKSFPLVKRRIHYATDVQSLWYLRGDLMAALAGTFGEAVAREKLSSITDMFEDLLPGGLRSRPSPLNSQFRN